MIDILNVLPHEVSRDLRGYILFFYGDPKTGKTTISSKFPKSLLLAFEKGYNAIPGIKAIDMNRWTQLREVLMQLERPEAKEMYHNIIIDTADLAYEAAKQFVFNKKGASEYGDIPYGQGYALVEEEFDSCMQRIIRMGYGLIFISHSQDKVFKDENGEEYNKITSTLDKRARKVVNRMSDIIGYARIIENPDNGEEETYLFMRGTTRFEAGSRFKYTSDYIKFSYDNLIDDISQAIDKLGSEDNAVLTDKRIDNYENVIEYNIEEELEQFYFMADALMAKDEGYAEKIGAIIEEILGVGKNIKNCTQKQAELVNLINQRLKELN